MLTAAGMANAYADEPQAVTGYVAMSSNYVGRGLAQSVGEPSLLAELNYIDGDGFYAGVSAASINWIDQLYPGNSVSIEVDGWLGYRRSFADDWLFKGGVLRLQFPGHYAPQDPPVARPDTTELFASIGWRMVSAKLNYAVTDSFGTPDSRGSWYFDVSASLPLGTDWSAGAHIGRKQGRGRHPITGVSHGQSSYTDYKVSLTRYFPKALSMDLAYARTNANPSLYTLNDYNVAGNHVWVMLQKSF